MWKTMQNLWTLRKIPGKSSKIKPKLLDIRLKWARTCRGADDLQHLKGLAQLHEAEEPREP